MEEITLEKIDIIRKRVGLSYAEAKDVLEKNNGNVVDSLIFIENNKKTLGQNVTDMGNDLLSTVKDIIKKGNVNRIKIKKDEKVLVDIPVNAGIAAGAISLFSPAILAVGAVTAIASKITLEIERPDGRIEVINDIVRDTYQQAASKIEEVTCKTANIVQDIKSEFSQKCNTTGSGSTTYNTSNHGETTDTTGNSTTMGTYGESGDINCNPSNNDSNTNP